MPHRNPTHLPDRLPQRRPAALSVILREARESDLQTFFKFQLDPVAIRMAAFTPKDPTDKAAYMAKWTRLLADPTIVFRAIMFDGQNAGSIASYLATWDPPPPEVPPPPEALPAPGAPPPPAAPPQRHVTYWIDRQHWGKGIATAALEQFLREFPDHRPLYASAARNNLASLRVLEKCGFRIIGYEKAFANARGEEIEEVMMMLAS